jgi:osmotically-inducible protein OsmY
MTASGAAPATSIGATDVRRFRLIALGAALSYFFDSENGKRRRKTTADRLAALVRRHGGRLVRGTVSETYALKQKATHLREEPKPQPDDVTLARKVETEIFREADVPKGQINVNAENGKIVLRGEVDSAEMIDELVAKARKVQGVEDVESLLHTPAQS